MSRPAIGDRDVSSYLVGRVFRSEGYFLHLESEASTSIHASTYLRIG